MDPNFQHPVFDLAREKVKHVIRQLEKPPEALENLLYTCFKCGSNKIYYIAKQVRSADEGWPYSMSAEIATINRGMDDNVKWVFLVYLK